ncbi:hypothetical protein [Paraburkholderia sp. RL18-085-BIA-A]|jgi:hypothetical protein|uniref:hypothetical protein n=1 Tax=Paraburkholderia sp. RL18-085-BIA-A TaxID=3031633 RepID=UPI0038B95A1A
MSLRTPHPVELREQALQQHMLLRDQKAPALTYGRFYQRLLGVGVFTTQLDLSIGLSVSKGHVSKALKAARLPPEVLRVFGPERRMSFRVVDALTELAGVIGAKTLTTRAEQLGERSGLTVSEILDSLVRGETPSHLPRSIKMSIGRGGRYIRIESPDIVKMISRLHELETALNLAARMAGL